MTCVPRTRPCVILCNMLVVGVWSLRIILSNSTTMRRIQFLLTYIAYTYFNFRLVNHLLPHCRRPCLKASSYSTDNAGEEKPIWVAPKAKQYKRLQNVFLDNRGFPDQSNNFNQLLHNIDGQRQKIVELRSWSWVTIIWPS